MTLQLTLAKHQQDKSDNAIGRRALVNHRLVELAAILVIFAAGLGGGVFVSRTVFDSVPHVEDEQSYLFQAKVFARGMIYAPAPKDPSFFAIPFVVNYQDKWFGKYTPGYPLILAVGVLLGSPWLVDPVLGALSAGKLS